MKKLLIEAFSLKNLTADSSDTAVLEALKEVMSKKDNEIVSLNEKISKSAEQTAEQLIKASGKEVTEDQKKTLLGIAATSGMDALNMFLGMMPAAAGAPETKEEKTPQLHTMVTNGGQGSAAAQGRESWNYDKWMEEDPDGFEAMADDPKQWDKFAAIYMAKFKVMPEKK